MPAQEKKLNKNKKALVIILELLALAIFLYLIILPFYPAVEYEVKNYVTRDEKVDWQDKKAVEEKGEELIAKAQEKEEPVITPNHLIISKIGVSAPIIQTDNEDYGLHKGAWLLPNTSTPDQSGNTVISAHRFKYLPPSNLTFYLLDKLEVGDVIFIIWRGENYFYRVKETKIVPADEMSILNPTDQPTLTLFTCDPIYSTKNRLVVVSELIKNDINSNP